MPTFSRNHRSGDRAASTSWTGISTRRNTAGTSALTPPNKQDGRSSHPLSLTSGLIGETLRSPGQPLEPGTRTFMESRFGQDFSQVRVHCDERAAASAKAMDASAYTSGSNIAFGKERYQPSTANGRMLIAHELAHVVQQRQGVELPVTAAGELKMLALPQIQGRTAGINNSVFGFPIQRQHESAGPGVQDTSGTAEKITRPEQVLSEYGMTCYGTAVMYMIQSYGLMPPDMTREEFEYAFTPLNPKGSDHTAAKSDFITVAGREQKDAKPIDLITKALEGTDRPSKRSSSLGKVTTTEATLRGADKGSMTVAMIMEHMPAILKAFQDQSKQTGYEFMKAHVPASGTAFAPRGKDQWIESSKEVSNGVIPQAYFDDGNTVMAGVSMSFPSDGHLDHWVVIVNPAEKKEIAGHTVFLYPADDPLGAKQVFVAAPNIGKVAENKLSDAGISSGNFKSRSVYTLLSGFAFRRNVSLKP
jgi:hypothetical protein